MRAENNLIDILAEIVLWWSVYRKWPHFKSNNNNLDNLTFPCCFSIRRIHSVISTESLDESNNNFIFLMFARLSEEQQFRRGGRSNKDNKPSFVQVRGTCQLKIFLKITGRGGIQLNFNFIYMCLYQCEHFDKHQFLKWGEVG